MPARVSNTLCVYAHQSARASSLAGDDVVELWEFLLDSRDFIHDYQSVHAYV